MPSATKKRHDETLELLNSALMLQTFSDPKKPERRPPRLMLSGENKNGKGSNDAAKFSYYHNVYMTQFSRLMERWHNMINGLSGAHAAYDIIERFTETRQWRDNLQAVYDTTTQMHEILCRAVDEYAYSIPLNGKRSTDFGQAEREARLAYPQLAMVEDFRHKAEAYLGITVSQGAAR